MQVDKCIKVLFLVVVLGFLSFPILNDLKPMYRNYTPHGVAPAKPYFDITVDNYISGKWQRRVTERAKKNSGLWDPFLRVSNEIMYEVFDQMGLYENASVFLGKENYMIQSTHLKEFNRENGYSLDKVLIQLEKLKKIQVEQAKRGKSVILVITPTIASLYPELLPEKYIDESRLARPSNYDVIKKKIADLKLLHVDAQELLYNKRYDYPVRFFAKTAAHWNDIASCLSLSEISKLLKEQDLPHLGNIECSQYTMSDTPLPKDLDLLDLANIILPERFYEKTPYVNIQMPLADINVNERPRVQLVGTSYLIAYYKHLKDWELARGIVQYFYFKLYRTEANRKFRQLNREKVQWSEVLDREITIVNIGMSNLSGFGNGFIEVAEKHLTSHK